MNSDSRETKELVMDMLSDTTQTNAMNTDLELNETYEVDQTFSHEYGNGCDRGK